jgi:hypothetical protein
MKIEINEATAWVIIALGFMALMGWLAYLAK